jgi:Protein of unknown function (DUF642)/PEP-CTERM motif
MKTQLHVSSLAASAALAFVPASQAAVIVNGSFEAPLVATGTFDSFGATSTSITGWVVVGINATIVESQFSYPPMIFQAQEDNQFLDLTGPGTNFSGNGVSQNVATIIGQQYAISFYVGSGTDFSTFTASTVDLSINGGARVSFTNPNTPTTSLDWQPFEFNFTAIGPVTEITFLNGSGPGNHLSALDNVTIAAIPEPSSFAMLAGALGLAGALARRRRSA